MLDTIALLHIPSFPYKCHRLSLICNTCYPKLAKILTFQPASPVQNPKSSAHNPHSPPNCSAWGLDVWRQPSECTSSLWEFDRPETVRARRWDAVECHERVIKIAPTQNSSIRSCAHLRFYDVVQVSAHEMRHQVDTLERVKRLAMIESVQEWDDVLVANVLQQLDLTIRPFGVCRRLKWLVELFDGNLCVCLCIQSWAKIRKTERMCHKSQKKYFLVIWLIFLFFSLSWELLHFTRPSRTRHWNCIKWENLWAVSTRLHVWLKCFLTCQSAEASGIFQVFSCVGRRINNEILII